MAPRQRKSRSAAAPDADTAALPAQGRMPVQQRSRERVERLLTEAAALIAERGSDELRMSELAERAGVSIGSVYQYFPDKAAVIRSLAQRYNAEGRACIEAELKDVSDLPGLQAAFGRLIDVYYQLFLDEPVIRDIWSGTQAMKGLRELELEDGRANGALLADALLRLRPKHDPARLRHLAFLVMQLGEATMRLAISVSRAEGDALVATYKQMVTRELAGA
jgi:AcrR family transcriptional regulator